MAALGKLLFFGTLFVTVCSAYALFQLAEEYEMKFLSFLGGLVAIVGFCLSIFTVREVLERMKEDDAMSLGDAVARTFYSYVMFASFVPLVGPLFGRVLQPKKPKNPFTDDSN